MPTFTWKPDYSAARRNDARLDEAKFGDGYSQRSPNGINTLMEAWDLSFTLRTKVEITEIVTFLETQKGAYSFDWVTPTGATRKFICRSWSDSYNHDGDCALSATFERVFEP